VVVVRHRQAPQTNCSTTSSDTIVEGSELRREAGIGALCRGALQRLVGGQFDDIPRPCPNIAGITPACSRMGSRSAWPRLCTGPGRSLFDRSRRRRQERSRGGTDTDN
jgi:hypothetical protein